MSTIQAYTTVTRPTASASNVGLTIFNTTTKNINVSDGANWRAYNSDGAVGWTGSSAYSLSLDGTDDYVDIGGVSSSIAASNNFTVSAWVKSSGGSGYIFRCSEAVDSTSFKENISLGIFSNKTYGLLQDGTPFIEFLDTSGTTVNDNAWHHIVMTISESSGTSTLKIYVGGSLAGTASGSITIPNTISVASIGRRPYNSSGNGDSYLPGLIDEVAMWDSALSASDVTSIYNSGVPDDLSSYSPVGWWRMGDNNAGTGTTITDQGSGGTDGTLVNGTQGNTSPNYSTSVPS